LNGSAPPGDHNGDLSLVGHTPQSKLDRLAKA
jgi:hypothetical protein